MNPATRNLIFLLISLIAIARASAVDLANGVTSARDMANGIVA